MKYNLFPPVKDTSAVLSKCMLRWMASLTLLVWSFWCIHSREKEHAQLARHERTISNNKQHLLARLSHELQTPLAGIVGLLNVLESECVESEQKLHVSLLQKNLH
jgi:signal transduction histidine kinase